jgi:glycosyltransferase involved in cell wall biosynthesis
MLTLIQPKGWSWYADEPAVTIPEARVVSLPVFLPGNHHLHVYRGLARPLRASAPDLFYYDQPPWSLSSAQAVRTAARMPCAIVGFTWQNLFKRYPPPFETLERYVHGRTTMIIAGNEEAAEVIRRRGYRGLVNVIPQFGVDLEAFRWRGSTRSTLGLPADGLLLAFVGRLVPEKGLETAVRAVARVPEARFVLAGAGPHEPAVRELASDLGITDRLHFLGALPSDRVPQVFHAVDAVILPSRTTPRWKEQFGRVLIEAMAAEVPVIGSSSGEIPKVIGDAGLVFHEGDVNDCARAIRRLLDPADRRQLAARGAARVQAHYAAERIAERFWEAWCEAYEAWRGKTTGLGPAVSTRP